MLSHPASIWLMVNKKITNVLNTNAFGKSTDHEIVVMLYFNPKGNIIQASSLFDKSNYLSMFIREAPLA